MPLFSSVATNGRGKATTPQAPSIPTIVSQASGQVSLSWTAPSFSGGAPITDYKIEYSSNSGSTWTEWAHTASPTASATVTGLADYVTYIFRVSAKNAVGTGIISSNSADAAQFNAASGGTESTVTNYNGTGQTWKVHRFTSAANLSVSRILHTSSILVVGAGNGGQPMDCGLSGNGGNGGGVSANNSFTFSIQSYAATIGSGGGGAGCPPSAGTASSFAGITASGGAGAGGGAGVAQPSAGFVGANGGTGTFSTITGSSDYYGSGGGGGGGAGSAQSSNGPGTYGLGGHGGSWSDNPTRGSNGVQGIVIVAYRIA